MRWAAYPTTRRGKSLVYEEGVVDETKRQYRLATHGKLPSRNLLPYAGFREKLSKLLPSF